MEKFFLFFLLLVVACNDVTQTKTVSPAFAEPVKRQTVNLEGDL